MSAAINYCVKFVKRPGLTRPTPDVFSYEQCAYPNPPLDDQVLLKTLYLSIDPVCRFRMNKDTGIAVLKAWKIGDVITGNGMGEVIESKNDKFKPGDIVEINGGMSWPWQVFCVLNANDLNCVPKSNELEYQMSYYGISGLTAFFALIKGGIQENSDKVKSIVISAGAGSVGHLAGQIARIYGCKPVIGICGSDKKCNILKNDLGFTDAINYKTENVKEKVKELCPNGVDFYFDNVGGKVSDEVVANMSSGGYISVVGAISQYQDSDTYPPPTSEFITNAVKENNIRREYFMVFTETEKFSEAINTLKILKNENGVKVLQNQYNGLENAGQAFCDMFDGKNIGKSMVKI